MPYGFRDEAQLLGAFERSLMRCWRANGLRRAPSLDEILRDLRISRPSPRQRRNLEDIRRRLLRLHGFDQDETGRWIKRPLPAVADPRP